MKKAKKLPPRKITIPASDLKEEDTSMYQGPFPAKLPAPHFASADEVEEAFKKARAHPSKLRKEFR